MARLVIGNALSFTKYKALMDEIQVTDPRLTFAAIETIENVKTRVNHTGGKTPPREVWVAGCRSDKA